MEIEKITLLKRRREGITTIQPQELRIPFAYHADSTTETYTSEESNEHEGGNLRCYGGEEESALDEKGSENCEEICN